MNINKPSLIINYNKDNSKIAIPMVLFMICFFSLLFFLSLSLSAYLWLLLAKTIQGILLLMIALFVVSLMYAITLSKSNKPAAVINEEGVWVNYFNLIPWSNIADVTLYKSPGTPIEVVAVLPKEYRSVFKNASGSGKMAILTSKLFGYCPILIANIELDNEDVIEFAQQFLKKQ